MRIIASALTRAARQGAQGEPDDFPHLFAAAAYRWVGLNRLFHHIIVRTGEPFWPIKVW
jgi:hypothetical protein